MNSRFQNLGEMMTLGRSDAAVTPSFLEGLTLEGPLGHTGKFTAPFVYLDSFCSHHVLITRATTIVIQQGK